MARLCIRGSSSLSRKLLNTLRQLLDSSPEPRRRTLLKASIGIETLEDRLAPATYVWTGGGANTNWTTLNNWGVVGEGVATRVPDERDDIIIDNTGFMGEIKNSVVNADFGGTVKSLTIDSTYPTTKTLTLNKDLTAYYVVISGGTLDGPEDLLVGQSPQGQPAATFSWGGGEIKGGAGSKIEIHSTVTASYISSTAGADLKLDRRQILVAGTLTWNLGKIILSNNAEISTTGAAASVINVSAAENLTIEGTGKFKNVGGQLNVGMTSAELNVKTTFENTSAVNVTQGTMTLTGSSLNSGTITLSADTVLDFKGGVGVDHYLDSTQGFMVSIITGLGTAKFDVGSKVHLTGSVVVNKVHDFSDVVDGTGNLQINGDYLWAGKKWTGSGTVQVGTALATSPTLTIGHVALETAHTLERKLTNYGTATWDRDDIKVGAGGSIENKSGALFDVKADKNITKETNAGKFKNDGTLRKSDGTGTAEIKIEYEGAGTIDEKEGTLKFTEKMSMTGGSIQVDPDAVLALAAAFDQFGGTVNVEGTLEVTGQYLLDAGTLTIDDGTVTATAGLLIEEDGSLLGVGTITADVTSSGEVTVGQEGSYTIAVAGDYTQEGGTTTVDGTTLTVTGSLEVAGGTFTLSGYGTVDADGGLSILSGAAMSGRGTIYGDVTNAGTLSVGSASVYTTVLTIGGNYTQTSTGVLNMEAFSTVPHDVDLLSISGTATLAGTLNFSLLGGYTPSVDDTFSLLSFSSRSGAFATLNLPTLGTGTWDPCYDDPLDTFTLWVV